MVYSYVVGHYGPIQSCRQRSVFVQLFKCVQIDLTELNLLISQFN